MKAIGRIIAACAAVALGIVVVPQVVVAGVGSAIGFFAFVLIVAGALFVLWIPLAAWEVLRHQLRGGRDAETPVDDRREPSSRN